MSFIELYADDVQINVLRRAWTDAREASIQVCKRYKAGAASYVEANDALQAVRCSEFDVRKAIQERLDRDRWAR